MLKLSAHIGFLWSEMDFYDRFAAARAAGFSAVELSSPEKYDEARIASCLRETGLALSMFIAPLGNVAGGEIGFLCVPGKEDTFDRVVRESIARAGRIGATQFMAGAGVVGPDMTRAQAEQTALNNIRRVLPLLEESNIRLFIEPVSRTIAADYYADSTAAGAALVEAVASPHVRLELDLYHAGLMGEDILDTWNRFGHLVGHIQVADVPGRHEPGTGKLPIVPFMRAVERSGYADHVSLEFHPSGSTTDSLRWIPTDWMHAE